MDRPHNSVLLITTAPATILAHTAPTMSQVVATAAQHLYEQEAARNDPERHEIVSELYRQLSRFRLGHDPHFSPAAVSTGSSPSPSSSSTSSFPGRQPLPRSQRLAALAPALCPLSPRTPMSSFSDTDTEEENDDGAEGDEDNDDSGRDGELGANTGRLPFVPPVFRRTSRDRTPWPSSHGRGSDATAPDSDADDDDDDYDHSNSSATGTSRNGSYASSGGATTVVSSMTPPRRLSSKVGPIVTVAGNAARPSLAVPRRQSSHQIQRHNLKRRRESQVTAMNDGTLLLLSPARYGGRRERCQSISAAPSASKPAGSPRAPGRRPSTAQPLMTSTDNDAARPPLRPLLGDRRPSAPDRPDVFVAMTTLASPGRASRQQELKLASPFRKHGANLAATMMTDDDSPALPASPSPPRPAASHWRLEPVKLCAPYDSHFYSEQQRSQGGRGDEMSPLMRRASEAASIIGDGDTSKPPRVRREVPLPPVIIPKPITTAAPAMERGDSTSSSASSSAASRFSYHTSPNSVTTALSSPATPSTWGTPPCLSSLPSPFPGLALPLSAAASNGAVCGHDMPAATIPAQQRPATASKADKPTAAAAVVFSTPSFSPSPSSMIPARRSETIRYEGESWLLCSP